MKCKLHWTIKLRSRHVRGASKGAESSQVLRAATGPEAKKCHLHSARPSPMVVRAPQKVKPNSERPIREPLQPNSTSEYKGPLTIKGYETMTFPWLPLRVSPELVLDSNRPDWARVAPNAGQKGSFWRPFTTIGPSTLRPYWWCIGVRSGLCRNASLLSCSG